MGTNRKEGRDGGDGKTSPFGNGRGAPQQSGSATGGRDFVREPTGSGQPQRPTDFAQRGATQEEGEPVRDVAQPAAPPTDRSSGENPASVVAAGKWPLANAHPNQRVGTGSIGNPQRPFKGLK